MSSLSIAKVKKNHPRFFTRLKNKGIPYGTVRNKKGFWVYYHSETILIYPKGKAVGRKFVLRKVKKGNEFSDRKTVSTEGLKEITGLKSTPKFNPNAKVGYKYKSIPDYKKTKKQ